MKKIFLYLSAILSMSLITVMVSAADIGNELSSNLVRLHIIAASDSPEDQAVKLKVRDAVLAENRYEPEEIPYHLEEIEQTAERILEENGLSYGVTADFGRFHFPRKQYKNITLPAGDYTGVRITLGEGRGQNWWCVMFPPLCFGEYPSGELSEEDMELLKNALSQESNDLISQDEIEIKFRVVEWFNEIF